MLAGLKDDLSTVVVDEADIVGVDYVGGIVGLAESDDVKVVIGENIITNKVVVVSSSVNAYLQATNHDETNLIGNVDGMSYCLRWAEGRCC